MTIPVTEQPEVPDGVSSQRWTKDKAGAYAAAAGVYVPAMGVIAKLASHSHLHSDYPHTTGAIGAVALAGLAYWLMLRLMRRLP
jgi:hypothetical protein